MKKNKMARALFIIGISIAGLGIIISLIYSCMNPLTYPKYSDNTLIYTYEMINWAAFLGGTILSSLLGVFFFALGEIINLLQKILNNLNNLNSTKDTANNSVKE